MPARIITCSCSGQISVGYRAAFVVPEWVNHRSQSLLITRSFTLIVTLPGEKNCLAPKCRHQRHGRGLKAILHTPQRKTERGNSTQKLCLSAAFPGECFLELR